MSFDSLSFMLFFLAVLALHRAPFSWQVKKWNLLLASYLFYAAWNPPFVALIWISTVTDWIVGNRMSRTADPRARRLLLLVSLAVNLGLLGYFKYASFVLENFVWLVHELGIDFEPAAPDIILPLGISFYTFQTLSYTITIYRGHARPARSLLDFALFVTFFPQLVAGPIVRAPEFLGQLIQPRRADARQLGWGLALLVLGLFQKTVLSDALLAPIADHVFTAPRMAGALDAWIGCLAFGGQIYFDFSGYSSCAIGVALCLGFVLPENFRFPYAALGFGDFWRRWHITLSTWLRDYLYLSLAADRRGRAHVLMALAVTMLLGGLWHGASWNFVIWGGLHGLFLVAERLLREAFGGVRFFTSHMGAILLGLATFACVTATWAFFRAQDLASAWALTRALFSNLPSRLCDPQQVALVLLLMGATLAISARLRSSDIEALFERIPRGLQVAILAFMILSIIAVPGDERAFIYFQF